MTHDDEWMPVVADLRGLSPRKSENAIVSASKGGVVRAVFNQADVDIGVNVTSPGPVTLVVEQFYFPGWIVWVDGVQAEQCPPKSGSLESSGYCSGPNGRIKIWVSQGGEHFVHVKYVGVPAAGLRNGLAFIVAVLSLVALWRLNRFKERIAERFVRGVLFFVFSPQ